MDLREADKGELSSWDDAVSKSEYGTVFHTLAWLDVLEKTSGLSCRRFVAEGNGSKKGIFPVFFKKKANFSIAFSPFRLATPYGGPILEKGCESSFFDALDAYSKKHGISYLDIMLSPGFPGIDAKKWGYSSKDFLTHFLDLGAGTDGLWNNLDKKCRTAVRKAQKEGVTVAESSSKKDVADFYRMYAETYTRSGQKPPAQKELFENAHDAFGSDMKMLFAEHGGDRIACSIFIIFGDRAYYWMNASHEKTSGLNQNNLLQWSFIEQAAKSGIKKYDLMGADVPSIARFKESFGGKLVTYKNLTKATSLSAKILSKGYSLISG
jgi:hypothetical protein